MSDRVPHSSGCACGCCGSGSHEQEHVNAPGLPEIRYRIGTHPDFLARMKARIHAWELLACKVCEEQFAGENRLERILDHVARAHPEIANPAEKVVTLRPLDGLGTRMPNDPAIALMDSLAVVSDVITFYQERIANETYLRTATERRSILELARTIGYELDPGVAAETYVAFRVDESEGAPLQAPIPAGTQLLSVPTSQGEVPQTFETAEELIAHRDWNALRPRLEHPLVLEEDLTHVFVRGTATGVTAGSGVLLLIEDKPHVRRVALVTAFRDEGYTRIDLAAGDTQPSKVLEPRPEGALDPDQPILPLTRANVEAHIVEKTWAEDEMQAFLTMHAWNAADVLAYVDDIRTSFFNDEARQLIAFRERAAFFGHNAPYYASLPGIEDSSGKPTSMWPENWDLENFSIWQDSLTKGYYYDEKIAGEYFDVYLERVVSELSGDSWAVFERPLNEFEAYRVLDVAETSRTGYGLSAKVSGLQLGDASGRHLSNNNVDKPTDFRFRRSIAHVKSEILPLAAIPITDVLWKGTKEVRLGTMVLGLRQGQRVVLTGEEREADGAIREELLTVESVTHSCGYTLLEFEEGLARSYIRETVTINANVVRVSHGETVAEEVLGSGNGAAKHQRFSLKKPPLTHLAGVGGSESTLTVRVGGIAWDQVPSFYGLDGRARAYVVRIDDDANATVLFGDGKSGARLPTGAENVTATYRSGIGSQGEVAANTITLLKTRPFGVRSVTNPFPASGADDPEVLEDARTNAPLTVRTMDRIVSLQDYEDYARAYPGIGKARADAVWTGTEEILHVTVADANGDAVVDPLFGILLASIEDARDPFRPVRLATYQPFVFFVTARVLIDQAYLWEDVRANVEAALRGSFSFEARGFGMPVTAAEVLQVVHEVEGVLAVDLDELYKTAPDDSLSGNPYETVLESHPARFDPVTRTVLPAELLLIHPFGINLSQMTA